MDGDRGRREPAHARALSRGRERLHASRAIVRKASWSRVSPDRRAAPRGRTAEVQPPSSEAIGHFEVDGAEARPLRGIGTRRSRARPVARAVARRSGAGVRPGRSCPCSSDREMDFLAPAEATAAPPLKSRADIADRFKWNLAHIFPDWTAWQAAYDELDAKIAALRGAPGIAWRRAGRTAARRCSCPTTSDSSNYKGLVFRVAVRSRRGPARQPDQRAAAAGADSVREGGAGQRLVRPGTAERSRSRRCRRGWRRTPTWRSIASRIEDLYRQQEHVLDDKGEHLLSLSSRFRHRRRHDAYAALSTADVKSPTDPAVGRRDGHADLRPVPRDSRDQPQPGGSRGGVRRRITRSTRPTLNTYASLYNGVLQRDWFHAQARGYTIDARRGAARQQHSRRRSSRNLIETTKAGHRAAAPLPPAAQARRSASTRTTPTTRRFRSSISIEKYPYDDVARVAAGVGGAARRRLPAAAARRPRRPSGSTSTRIPASGAARTRRRCTACTHTCCSNYNDTLDAVFTLAHEMGHSMHTLLSHRAISRSSTLATRSSSPKCRRR